MANSRDFIDTFLKEMYATQDPQSAFYKKIVGKYTSNYFYIRFNLHI